MDARASFELPALEAFADDILGRRPIAGTDKIGQEKFRATLREELGITSRKLKGGTYKFTRYRQLLRTKGAGKAPREIVVPTYRDRVALRAILAELERSLGTDVDREIPNAKIRRIRQFIQSIGCSRIQYSRIDVSNFFGSIQHGRLMQKLTERGVSPDIRVLVLRAITNSTTSTIATVGIPQGLCISPLLANAYITEFFQPPKDHLLVRHLDDILLLGESAEAYTQAMCDSLARIGLTVNAEKRSAGRLDGGLLSFLGYRFTGATVSASPSACQRLISSIERIVGQYLAKTATYFRRSMTTEFRKNIFVDRLNRKIVGAIYRGHSYGWVVYYSAINDGAQLRWLDTVIRRVVCRRGLEAISSSIESVYASWNTFRHSRVLKSAIDYDSIATHEARRQYLVSAGEIDHDADLETERIQTLFEQARDLDLRDLERDVGLVS